jgi:hypothetical protein
MPANDRHARVLQAGAALRTSASLSAFSAVSSLTSASSAQRSRAAGSRGSSTGNQTANPSSQNRGRTSCSRDVLDSDSDDQSEDLDESDNAWVELPGAPPDELIQGQDEDTGMDAVEESRSRRGCHIGDLLENIQWHFEEVDEENPPARDMSAPLAYESPEEQRALKEYVVDYVNNPYDALELCGLNHAYVAKLAANSNEYVQTVLFPRIGDKNNRLCGVKWKRITMKEMYRFLGIMLKISIAPIDGEGYAAYFRQDNKTACGIEIQNTKGFAVNYMTLSRFKQIRAALHPENSAYSAGGDKCYQLRSTI